MFARYSLVRWSVWLFPTYTLGAMAAAQLFSAAVKVEPKILSKLKQGDFSDLLVWLREHVHSWGVIILQMK